MHQDSQYFPTINDTMIAGVVHVSEATDEMGCFRVYPGSHRELGRCEGMMGSGQNVEIHKRYPIEKATVLQAEPGDVVFFSLLHLTWVYAEYILENTKNSACSALCR